LLFYIVHIFLYTAVPCAGKYFPLRGHFGTASAWIWFFQILCTVVCAIVAEACHWMEIFTCTWTCVIPPHVQYKDNWKLYCV